MAMMMNRLVQRIRRYNRKSEEEKLAALIVENEDEQQQNQQGEEDEAEAGERANASATPTNTSVQIGDLTKITKNDTTKERRQKFKHSFDRNNVIMVSQPSSSKQANRK